MSFWELDLPWAYVNVLQTIAKIKRLEVRGKFAGREGGSVCWRDVKRTFILSRRLSAIAVRSVERRRGSGRSGKRSRDTGPARRARKNGRRKAGATESASGAGKNRKQSMRQRG
jgi:hypothetical protein